MKINLYTFKKILSLLLIFLTLAANNSFAHDIPEPSLSSGVVVVYDNAFDSLSGNGLSIDNTDIASSFILTYPISSSISFEIGALTGFKSSANISNNKSGSFHGKPYSTDGALTLQAKTSTSYLSGIKLSSSANKSLNIHAKIGLIFWEVDFSSSGSATFTYNGSPYNSESFLKVDGSDPFLGIGVSYKTSEKSMLNLDYYTLASTNAIEGAAFDFNGYSISWSINF
jgi:hypothetical protein